MPRRRLVLTADNHQIDAALRELRRELDIADHHPPAAQADALNAAGQALPAPGRAGVGSPPRPIVDVQDARDIPLVTVDPPTSRDLDQAAAIQRTPSGYLLHYAIACLAFFVRPTGALDRETHRRATTIYGPGHSFGLHPDVIAANAGSLLPGKDRLAYLWQINIAESGEIERARVVPALVRSRAKLSYQQVQDALDARQLASPRGAIQSPRTDTPGAQLPAQVPADFAILLAQLGKARLHQEALRGGISLDIPEQRVEATDAGYVLSYRSNVPVESYNAQLSLTCGIAAAQLMRDAGVGIFRTLPPADPRDVARLRHTAKALGLKWPTSVQYPDFVRSLTSAEPAEAAFLTEATTLFRGAGYQVFTDGAPTKPAPHAAIAAEYAHVTAPLRRLVDRYGLEICAAHCAGKPIPSWITDVLDQLPAAMAAGTQLANRYEREAVNIVEAAVLCAHVGKEFEGVVLEERNGGGIVMLRTPAVRTRLEGQVKAGEQVRVKVSAVDLARGTITLQALSK